MPRCMIMPFSGVYIISAWGLGLLVQQGRAISGPQFEERVTEHDPRFFRFYNQTTHDPKAKQQT